jgi:hypothetical protein
MKEKILRPLPYWAGSSTLTASPRPQRRPGTAAPVSVVLWIQPIRRTAGLSIRGVQDGGEMGTRLFKSGWGP